MKITFTEMREILALYARVQAQDLIIVALLTANGDLRKQIFDLLAGDSATLAKATAAFKKAEELEAKARAGLPASPPVVQP